MILETPTLDAIAEAFDNLPAPLKNDRARAMIFHALDTSTLPQTDSARINAWDNVRTLTADFVHPFAGSGKGVAISLGAYLPHPYCLDPHTVGALPTFEQIMKALHKIGGENV